MKFLEKLLDERHLEICQATLGMNLEDSTEDACVHEAKGIVGIRLHESAELFYGKRLFERTSRGYVTVEEAVTVLNNLPIGQKIQDIQRQESEGIFIEAGKDEALTLEELEDLYQVEMASHSFKVPNTVKYVYELEDLVRLMQGKSFADTNKVSALEYDLAALQKKYDAFISSSTGS